MLEEYRLQCKEKANAIQGWEALSKNELCNKYIETEDAALKDAYLAAILYRYWKLIPKFYYQSANVCTPEDCYDWLVESVLCALNCKRWTESDSSIYKDPNGPDKVINRAMKCARLNFYQFINRKKRKDNFGLLSLDELKENLHDNSNDIEDPETGVNDETILSVKEYIKDVFNGKEYFLAFMLDCIVTENIFDRESDVTRLNQKSLTKLLRELDTIYAKQFANRYDFEVSRVLHALAYCQGLTSTKIQSKIEYNLLKLKHDRKLLEVLSC